MLSAGLLNANAFGWGGPLDDIRSEVHSGGASDDDDDDDDDFDDDGVCLFCGVDAGGSTVGAGGGGLGLAMSTSNWPHPYFDGAPGYYVAADAKRAEGARNWSVRAHATGAYVLGGLWRVGGQARAGAGFFEFDTGWDWLYDPVEADALTLGDFNLAVSPVRGRRFSLRAGAGARVMFDSKPAEPGVSGPAAGWNATMGLELFPVRPVVIAADFDVGSLGRAFVWKAGGRLGVMMGPLEIFGGVDHTVIGNVRLTGVTFGMGGWF